jgi:hypothetical protein
VNPLDPQDDPHAHPDDGPAAPGAPVPPEDAPEHWRTWWHRETALALGAPRAPDRYAARRAEPRLFAFLWTVYLLVAVLGAVLWLARTPIAGPSAFSPAARTMLTVIAAGVVILWPMTRLSQVPPARPVVRAVALDLFIMLGPAQMVIWPLIFLADWPVKVVAAVAAQLAAWGAVVGAVLAVALVGRSHARGAARSSWRPGIAWMLVVVLLTVVLPLGVRALAGTSPRTPEWAGALSPFDFGGSMLGQGFSGPTASPGRWRWAGIAALGAGAGAVWIVAAANEATGNRTSRTRFV